MVHLIFVGCIVRGATNQSQQLYLLKHFLPLKAELVEDVLLNASEIFSTVAPAEAQTNAVLVTIRYVRFYFFSVALPFGLIANVLSLVVFGALHLKKTSTGHYLMALAVVNTMYLSGEYMIWISDYMQLIVMGGGFVHKTDSACKIVPFILYYGRLFSAWLTVVITIERFVAIAYPLQVSILSTPTRAKVLILLLAITCLGICSFPLYTVYSQTYMYYDGRNRCNTKRGWRVLYDTIDLIVITFGEMVIPSGLVCLFTSLILRKLFKSRQVRREVLSSSVGNNTHRRQEVKLTATLLAIAITFFILRLPLTVFYNLNDSIGIDYDQVVVYYSAYMITFLSTSTFALTLHIILCYGQHFAESSYGYFVVRKLK